MEKEKGVEAGLSTRHIQIKEIHIYKDIKKQVHTAIHCSEWRFNWFEQGLNLGVEPLFSQVLSLFIYLSMSPGQPFYSTTQSQVQSTKRNVVFRCSFSWKKNIRIFFKNNLNKNRIWVRLEQGLGYFITKRKQPLTKKLTNLKTHNYDYYGTSYPPPKKLDETYVYLPISYFEKVILGLF